MNWNFIDQTHLERSSPVSDEAPVIVTDRLMVLSWMICLGWHAHRKCIGTLRLPPLPIEQKAQRLVAERSAEYAGNADPAHRLLGRSREKLTRSQGAPSRRELELISKVVRSHRQERPESYRLWRSGLCLSSRRRSLLFAVSFDNQNEQLSCFSASRQICP